MATESQLEELRKRINHDGGMVLNHMTEYRQGSSSTRFKQETENAISAAANRVGVPRNLLKALVHFSCGGDWEKNKLPENIGGWVTLPFVGVTFYEGQSYEMSADWHSPYFSPNCLVQCVILARELKNRAEDGGSWKSAVRDHLSVNRFDYIMRKPWGSTSEKAVQRVLDLWKTYDEADIRFREQGWGALVGWSTWTDLLIRKEKECKDLNHQNGLLKIQKSTDAQTILRLQRENADLLARNFAINAGLVKTDEVQTMGKRIKTLENELAAAMASNKMYRESYDLATSRAVRLKSEVNFTNGEFKQLSDKYHGLREENERLRADIKRGDEILKSVKKTIAGIPEADFDTSSYFGMLRAKNLAREALRKIDLGQSEAFNSLANELAKKEAVRREQEILYGSRDPFYVPAIPYPRVYDFHPNPPVKTQEERISTLEHDVQGLKFDVAKNAIRSSMNSMKISDMERNRNLFGPHPSGSTINSGSVGNAEPCGCKVS